MSALRIRSIVVDEFTSPQPISVDQTASLAEVERVMRTNEIRHLPVVNGKTLVGVLSDRDLKLGQKFGQAKQLTAGDIMSTNPFVVRFDAPLEEVAFEMSRQKIGSALVEGPSGELHGIFTSTDALNALIEILRGEV